MTNDEQDTVILKALQTGLKRFSQLPGVSTDERLLDRRLQALKRRGKIKFLKKADGGPGWSLTEAK